MLGDLVHDPRFRDAYEGSVSTALRHAWYWMLFEIPNLADDWRSAQQRLKQAFETHNLQALREMMNGLLDEQAAYLHTLLDFGKKDSALSGWESLCSKVAGLDNADDRRIATVLLLSNPELARFRERVEELYDIEGINALQAGLEMLG